MTEKIDDLHEIAKALLIYETLSGEEIRDLIIKILNRQDHLKRKRAMIVSHHQRQLGLKPNLQLHYMIKYYTRGGIGYGSKAKLLVKSKALPLCGKSDVAFDTMKSFQETKIK